MSVANQCLSCGVERPADAPGSLCPGCATSQSASGRTFDSSQHAEGMTSEIKPAQTPAARSIRFATGIFESARQAPRLDTGGNFGEYEIISELGRGGMGIVYEARQTRLNRLVALKMMRAGLVAGEHELRRFQNEAQAVARLDHPGIVQIYEVGEHNGQNFLSMRLVTGGSLLSLLDKFKHNPRAAAALMVRIADAVSHAHVRGILHRDLKPANILIDEAGNPHITDFGLAKQVESDIEITQSGAIVGTPSYMAPEQAAGKRGSITTATDVYGLGAVFYTLLTGKAPFTRDSVVETLDAVRQVEPARPSNITAVVPRDLETICLKCLEKDPARRYASARALADDLAAWLESRPIAARRVRAAERAWLWCKRKPALAALLATASLAVIAGAVTVIAVQSAANNALAAKNAALAEANTEAEQRFTLAMDAIKSFYTGVSDDVMLREKNLSPLRKKLLESARGFYQLMEKQLEGKSDRASRAQLANAYQEIGTLTGSIDSSQASIASHEKSLKLRRALAAEPGAEPDATADVADSLHELSVRFGNMRQNEQVLNYSGQSVLFFRQLVKDHPQNERYRWGLAKACGVEALGRRRANQTDQAMAELREIEAMYQSLCRDFPDNAEYQTGRAGTISSMSSILHDQGKKSEARALMSESLALFEQIAQSHRADPKAQQSLAKAYMNTASRCDSAHSELAVSYYRRAITMWEALIAQSTGTFHLNNIAVAYDSIAKRFCTLGRTAEEIAAYGQELAAFERAGQADPANAVFSREIADSCEHIATYQLRQGRAAEALANCLRATQIRESLQEADPTNAPWMLATAYDRLGDAQVGAGQASEAQVSYLKSLNTWQKCADAQAAKPVPAYLRAIAVAQRKLGRAAEAASNMRQVLQRIESMPFSPENWLGMARCRAQLYALSLDAATGVTSAQGETQAGKAIEEIRRYYTGSHPSLQDALNDGYIDLDRLEQMTDVDPLRSRADFQALLTELRWQAPPEPAPTTQ